MKTVYPDYYPYFHCLADRCCHTCCAGWEIDIDDDSLKRYQNLPGEFGDHVRACISTDEIPHFILTAGERCPLLTGNNLCELIKRYGESSLCQICTDHPRFRNYWSDRVEIGLGMACEEAARLILTSDHPMRLIEPDGEEPDNLEETEEWLMNVREELLNRVEEYGPAARLKEYLIYRHIADALYDGRINERIAFVEKSYRMILDGWDGSSIPDLTERARKFSNEVEYDDEKLEAMIAEEQNCR